MEERARVQPAEVGKRRSLRRAFVFSLGGIIGVAALAALTLYVSGRGRLSAAIEDVRKSGGKMPPTVEESERAEHEPVGWIDALPEPVLRDQARDELLEALSEPHEDPALTQDLAARLLAAWGPWVDRQTFDLCSMERVPEYIDLMKWSRIRHFIWSSMTRADCYFLLEEEGRALDELEQALCGGFLLDDDSYTMPLFASLCRTISGMLSRGSETFDWQLVRRRLARTSSPVNALRMDLDRDRAEVILWAHVSGEWEASLDYMDLDLETWREVLLHRHVLATRIREIGRLLDCLHPPHAQLLRNFSREAADDHLGTFRRQGVFLDATGAVRSAVAYQAERDLVDLGLLARTEGVEEALRQVEESQDPFTGHPYRTRLEEDGTLVLWSVGPDEFDDGGTCAPLTLWHEPGPDFVVRVHGAGR